MGVYYFNINATLFERENIKVNEHTTLLVTISLRKIRVILSIKKKEYLAIKNRRFFMF